MTTSTHESDTQTVASGDYIWVTRLGQEIPLRNMEDSHLLNTEVWARRRLAAVNAQHEESKLWADIDGKGSGNGFSGFEDRILGLETALSHLRSEISDRGLVAHAEPASADQD